MVGPLLGEEHALNFSTALYGLLQYSVLFAFGESIKHVALLCIIVCAGVCRVV